MTIIIGMTHGITDGMATAHTGMVARTGTPVGGMTLGTTRGSMAGIARGGGIIRGIGRLYITVRTVV